MNKTYIKDTKKAYEYFLKEISFMTSPFELKELIETNIEKLNIIDVRKYEDYMNGHIPFAIHIPFDDVEKHLKMLNKDKLSIVYGYSLYCKRGAKACTMIAKEDYPVMELKGGFKIWDKLGFEIVSN